MVRRLASSLTSAGVDTHVATTNDNGANTLDVPLGQPVRQDGAVYWFFPRQARFYTVSLPLASWLARHVTDFDVVHIHALFSFASLPASHYAHRSGVPYIVRPLGTLNTWGMTERRPWLKRASFRLLESRIVSHASRMHYTSEAERVEASRWTGGIPSDVIPNPVDDAQPPDTPGAFRARLGISAERPIVLFLSRIDEKKGLDLLLDAFAQLRARVPEALLVIAGEGSPELVGRLRQQASRLGLGEQDLIWAGFLAGDDKRAALADATVFALPSYSENFGIAVAEAMAAGKPVVVTDQVAIHHDVSSAKAGLVVPCDAAALCGALETVLRNTESAGDMGRHGAALVAERYSTRAVTARIVDLYTDLANAASRTAARTARLGAIQGHA